MSLTRSLPSLSQVYFLIKANTPRCNSQSRGPAINKGKEQVNKSGPSAFMQVGCRFRLRDKNCALSLTPGCKLHQITACIDHGPITASGKKLQIWKSQREK